MHIDTLKKRYFEPKHRLINTFKYVYLLSTVLLK